MKPVKSNTMGQALAVFFTLLFYAGSGCGKFA